MTVAPLTAAVLAGRRSSRRGSPRVSTTRSRGSPGLLGTAAVGAAIAGSFAASSTSRLPGVRLGPRRARGRRRRPSGCRWGAPTSAGLPAAPGARAERGRRSRPRCTASTSAWRSRPRSWRSAGSSASLGDPQPPAASSPRRSARRAAGGTSRDLSGPAARRSRAACRPGPHDVDSPCTTEAVRPASRRASRRRTGLERLSGSRRTSAPPWL